VSLTIAGSNLAGVMAVNFSPTATVTIAASAPTGPVNVSVSSSAGISNALVFNVLPASTVPDGIWSGTTSQNLPVSITTANNFVTAYSYDVNFPYLGPNCPVGETVTSGPATSIPITGSTFTTSTISGTFQSPAVSGTINWTLSLPGCSASSSVTWSAVIQ
jgi:hypothetical protein